MDSIQINTGEVRIPFIRDGQDVGEISFNPKDAAFAERFYKIVGEFSSKMDEYETRKKELTGDPDEAAIALLKETCQFIRDRIDYVFGTDTSQKAFGNALVLDVFSQFFDGITPYIQQARVEKIAKYLPPTSNRKPRKRK
jgi:hypothetical protein